MPRSTNEWRGKTDDSVAPQRVRDRIFERANHVCHICKLEIKTGETWQLDHVIALINSGENCESNLAPAHKHCHVIKSALDVKDKSKVARVRQKHNGIRTRPVAPIKSAPFAVSERTAKRQSIPKLPIPQRKVPLYAPKEEQQP